MASLALAAGDASPAASTAAAAAAASASPSEGPRLDTLPADVLLAIIANLDTSSSVAHLSRVARRLRDVVQIDGWRTFVRARFPSLAIVPPPAAHPRNPGAAVAWRDLARSLTSQSREWERKALVVDVYLRPERHDAGGGGGRGPGGGGARGRNRGGRGAQAALQQAHTRGAAVQTVLCQIVLDVRVKDGRGKGGKETELLVWGAGEDVMARRREKNGGRWGEEVWMAANGAKDGFLSGRDDVTSVKVLAGDGDDGRRGLTGVLVGRASGELRLVSSKRAEFGKTVMRFAPSMANLSQQKEIQSFDVNGRQATLAAATKEGVHLYPLPFTTTRDGLTNGDGTAVGADASIEPVQSIMFKELPGCKTFKFIRPVKYMHDNTLAVGFTSSLEPLRYVTMRPDGVDEVSAAKTQRSHVFRDTSPKEPQFGTVRALEPVDVSSMAGGHGQVLLSSWDDGKVRLQDLRTPCPFDRVYQDNFDPTTPLESLLCYGAERFIGGSGRSPVVKMFDFRWPTRGYYYTAGLPCDSGWPFPHPRHPTVVSPPTGSTRARCDHTAGVLCRWHELSRHDFYRPNYNVYLPYDMDAISPVYSLAKASDTSPTVYAGISGAWAELTLKSGDGSRGGGGGFGGNETGGDQDLFLPPQPPPPQQQQQDNHVGAGAAGSRRGGGNNNAARRRSAQAAYTRMRGRASFIETGDGYELADLTHSHRVPGIRKQKVTAILDRPDELLRKRNRMDDWLQVDDDFSLNLRYVF